MTISLPARFKVLRRLKDAVAMMFVCACLCVFVIGCRETAITVTAITAVPVHTRSSSACSQSSPETLLEMHSREKICADGFLLLSKAFKTFFFFFFRTQKRNSSCRQERCCDHAALRNGSVYARRCKHESKTPRFPEALVS